MKRYNPSKIEKKWQDKWDKSGIYVADDTSKKLKYYTLIEFPYPSGEGLHVGHPRSYTALDIISRKKRMNGFNVLYPIGWDAFGLPTENYAIKTGVHPKEATKKNIKNFKRQLKSLGFSFDWSREISTSDPKYYKWTQWIFLQLFKKHLAYKDKVDINWCTSCNVGLSNEEVTDGVCERCGGEVIRKEREQWMLKITEYADRLISDLEMVDYLDQIKKQQIDWIGKRYGAQVGFSIDYKDDSNNNFILSVFTTRPDTLFGATYMVVAPEHELITKFKNQISNIKDVEHYLEDAKKKSELERTNLEKVKTGVEIKGIKAINPVNAEKIPIFTSDYVLASYGTGAIMAVPGHDQRDYEFAEKFNLPIKEVISGGDLSKEAHTGEGMLVNSGFLDGLSVQKATIKMIDWLEKEGLGQREVQYHLRDWVFSRQRYWGEPIPIINCSKCGHVPVPEKDLPVELPEIKEYKTTKTGDSPLALIKEWVNVKCPRCSGDAKRETDTMPQWAGSSWYYLRYTDPHNDKELASKKALKYWMPVDWYNGGDEHTNLHLLYSRFWHKFLYDIKVVPTPEPYAKRTSHGLILGDDGEKMSKSRGNVVNPDDIVEEFGADTFRVYEMFMGPFDQATPWSTQGVKGARKFLEKVWDYVDSWIVMQNKYPGATSDSQQSKRKLHKVIKQVTEQIDSLDFNTCISAFMTFINEVRRSDSDKFGKERGAHYSMIDKIDLENFLKILAPFAPHVTEELWEHLGNKDSIHSQKWPEFDLSLIQDTVLEIPVQINGKVRAKIEIVADDTEAKVKEKALVEENVVKWLEGKKPKKVIYVKGKILNIVV